MSAKALPVDRRRPLLAPLWAGAGRILRDRLGAIGLVLIIAVVGGALLADVIAVHDPLKIAPRERFALPSADHLLGTDHLGRDLFARVLHGARLALGLALSAIVMSLVLGVGLGLISGYGPRWVDTIMMLLFEALRSFPTVMLALAITILLGAGLQTVLAVIVLVSAPAYARIIRTQVLAVRNAEYVLASRSVGASATRIVLMHIMPNIIGPLLIIACMDIPVVITIEAGMSFLGLGIPPPAPSWGTMLNEAQAYVRESPWPAIAGGGALVLATLGFTFLGETLRDLFDPRLAKRSERP